MKSRTKYLHEWQKKNKARYKNKREQLMHRLKINGCAICGYDKCDAALDFHHVNPGDKKFLLVINGLSRTDKSLVEELNKCILLCRNFIWYYIIVRRK